MQYQYNSNPYQAPSRTPYFEEDYSYFSYGGFWQRLIAHVLDLFILGFLEMPFLYLAAWVEGVINPAALESEYISSGLELFGLVLTLVLVVGFWKWKAATPGKMIMGLVITNKRGEKPSTLQFIWRYFAYIISAIPFCLGFLWVAFDSKKRGFHDLLSGTVVLKKNG